MIFEDLVMILRLFLNTDTGLTHFCWSFFKLNII